MGSPLTAAAVAKLKPGAARREIRDAACPGLHLVVQTSGAKSFALRFRRPNGRPCKLTLGPANLSGQELEGPPEIGAPLTLAAARWLASEIHRKRAMGRDVAADARAEKKRRRTEVDERAGNTFAAAAHQFITEYARPKNRRWRDVAAVLGLKYPGDAAEATAIKGGLAQRWRDKPIAEIDGHDIYAVVDESRRLGIPGMKSRVDGLSDGRGRAMARALSKFFAWLVQHRKIVTNPCAAMYVPPLAEARDRVLTEDEIRLFWKATDGLGEPFGPLFKLLLLTGARLREVAQMSRLELSKGGAVWELPGARTKNKKPHVVFLPPLARDCLRSISQIAGSGGYIFTTTGLTPVSGFSKAKRELDQVMLAAAREQDPEATVAPWRLHDLRRSCATGMAEIGIAPHIVEACLNHVSGARAGVAGTYNRAQYADEKRTAWERWATHVEGLVTGCTPNIIPMRNVS